MRSYSDVVSGSGKFVFAVSARYLFGVYCNCLRAILPNLVQLFLSRTLSGSSDSKSESELLCR